ncbi:MAG TPA: hypothetical protein VM120_29310 [Bryobacteraceae bacterium]|nr:hypothetical protein [Bryobacteraceae bacterium]
MMEDGAQVMLRGDALRLIGAHYLTGAAGATPGGREGALYRESLVDLEPLNLDPKGPCVHTAGTVTAFGHSVCAGRWATLPGPRPARAADADLQRYLEEQKARKEAGKELNNFFDIYSPRLPMLKGKKSQAVWGEDCRGKRHFDCVGLVNFLLSRVCNVAESYKQMGISADIHMHLTGTTQIPLGDPPVSGDILIPIQYIVPKLDPGAPADAPKPKPVAAANEGHIALLLNDGRVIQAKDPDNGVVIGPYHSGSWFYRGRYPDSCFISAPAFKKPEPRLLSTS